MARLWLVVVAASVLGVGAESNSLSRGERRRFDAIDVATEVLVLCVGRTLGFVELFDRKLGMLLIEKFDGAFGEVR